MKGAAAIRGIALRRRLALALLPTALLGGCGEAGGDTRGEGQRIAEVLGLAAGMHVADVGAGDGEWTRELAERVGPQGRVWATEVDPELVEKLEESVVAELPRVTAVFGSQEEIGLPAGCCDAVLLRMVYHHFTDPEPMRAGLLQALKPGGRIAVIDIVPQKSWRKLSGVPERGGHGIEPEDLIAEMEAAGFTVVARHEAWNDDPERYCVVFAR